MNAEIEVIVTQKSNSSNLNSTARLAISIEGSSEGSFTESFPSSLTLYEVLVTLVDSGKLNPAAFLQDPEIIYIRQKFQGESLKNTNLSSIGLAG